MGAPGGGGGEGGRGRAAGQGAVPLDRIRAHVRQHGRAEPWRPPAQDGRRGLDVLPEHGGIHVGGGKHVQWLPYDRNFLRVQCPTASFSQVGCKRKGRFSVGRGGKGTIRLIVFVNS